MVRCSCGSKSFSTAASTLKNGQTQSCGCLQKQRVREILFHDLSGKVFGKLFVLELYKIDNKGTKWLCQCSCNSKPLPVDARKLVGGRTVSCGCQSESFIASTLKKYCIDKYNAIIEYRICKNPNTGRWLPYDIYIPATNTFVEIHGSQHYKLDSWHILQANKNATSAQEEFKYQKHRDNVKRRYAKKFGIYIEIDLRKIKTLEQAIMQLES